MEPDEEKDRTISYRRNGKEGIVKGKREGKSEYIRWPKHEARQDPLIRAAIPKDAILNNVWVIPDGRKLIARIRVSKRTGGFAIAATVTLGVIVAKAIHDLTKNSE